MIDVFTPKKISPDRLCKSNHRQVKNSILFPRCAIYLRGMLHTAEIISAMCCTYSAEMISTVCCTLLRLSLWCVQRSSPRCDAHRGDHFVIEYLRKIETEFENTLGGLSGAQMG